MCKGFFEKSAKNRLKTGVKIYVVIFTTVNIFGMFGFCWVFGQPRDAQSKKV